MWKATPRQRRIGLVLSLIGVAGLVAAAIPAVRPQDGAMVAATAPAATVEIANFAFTPPDLRVAAGTTVIWKNADDSPHRISDDKGAYASSALDTDDSFAHTFATPGVYRYFCSIHPYMKGKIVVRPPAPRS
jgi:plastocyanin